MDFDIQGRIVRFISENNDLYEKYMWEISHYYKPDGGATFYHPSQTICETKQHATERLMQYMSIFTNTEIEINAKYSTILKMG